jgi:hypothetical protein
MHIGSDRLIHSKRSGLPPLPTPNNRNNPVLTLPLPVPALHPIPTPIKPGTPPPFRPFRQQAHEPGLRGVRREDQLLVGTVLGHGRKGVGTICQWSVERLFEEVDWQ